MKRTTRRVAVSCFLVASMRRAVLALVAMVVLCGAARAQERRRIDWRGEWRRVGVLEYVLTPTLFASNLIVRTAVPPAVEPLWTRPLLFDTSVRDWLREGTRSARNTAATVSDVLLVTSTAHPLLIDTLVVAGIGRNSWDVAWQMEVIGLQSYSLTILLNSISKRVFARQRPYADACAEDPEYSDACESSDRFRSFYSGHSAQTATSAGLVCAHHTHVPLYGGGWLDAGACLASLAGTFTTGALRIAADRHWATDVLTGHVIGFTTGYLIPTLIYYHGFRGKPVDDEGREAQQSTQPVVFSWGGRF